MEPKFLYNEDHKTTNENAPAPINNYEVDITPASHNEVRVANQRFKTNQTTGYDGLPAEWCKTEGNTLMGCMHQLMWTM